MTETITFHKMQGLGNDFIIFDMRSKLHHFNRNNLQKMADRKHGIGCDQIIYIEAPHSKDHHCFMRILNADGSEVEQCGNAARCVAAYLTEISGLSGDILIETTGGLLKGTHMWGNQYGMIFPPPHLLASDIPLADDFKTTPLPFVFDQDLKDPFAVNIGNPHLVFFVPDVNQIDLTTIGPLIEHHPLFPKRINVEIVQILSPNHLRMRVWERGVGITESCGSGACASVVAAHLKGAINHKAKVTMDGGDLEIDWTADGPIHMKGSIQFVFNGTLDKSFLEEKA